MNLHVWWYAARSGGIVAWALLAASVVAGLLPSGRLRPGGVRPAWTLDLHRFLGGLGITFTVVHVASILMDSYTDIGPTDVLVPLVSSWRPAAVAWGVVALYLAIAVELTSLARRAIPHRWWKAIHLSSYATFAFSTVHLLTAGTDAANPVLRAAVAATTMVVAGLTAWRIAAPLAPRRTRGGHQDETTDLRGPSTAIPPASGAAPTSPGPHPVGVRAW